MFDVSTSRSIRWTLLLSLMLVSSAFGAEAGSLRGTVTDPLGAVIVSATVELLEDTSVVAKTTTDSAGNYLFPLRKSARYEVRADAPTFQSTTSKAVFVSASGRAEVNITLAT